MCKSWKVCVLALVAVSLTGCSGRSAIQSESDLAGTYYNNWNIHHYLTDRGRHEAWYTGRFLVADQMIPAGTPLTLMRSTVSGAPFAVKTPDGVTVHYILEPSRMGMTAVQFREALLSRERPDFSHLSAIDRQGITEGKALVGMSREGVIVALGRPSRHRTPSLEAAEWLYWRNRFAMMTVTFDASGKVASVR